MRRAALQTINGNPNIGLYFARHNDILISGVALTEKERRTISDILGCEIITTTIAGTPYPGIFLLSDSDTLYASPLITEHELARLRAHANVVVIDTTQTAIANAMLIKDKKAVISTDGPKDLHKTLTSHGFHTIAVDAPDFEGIGALCVIDKDTGIIAPVFPETSIEKIQNHLDVTLTTVTLNADNPFLRSAIVISDMGLLIGQDTTTSEVITITEVFS